MSTVIFVSLRMAASAVAPSASMALPLRLRARGAGVEIVSGSACQWALKRKQNTLEAAAHLRLVIFVSLRMAASAVAPSALM